MIIPVPIFLPQAPYIEIKKAEVNFFKGKTVYEKHEMGEEVMNAKFQKLVKKNRRLLLDNGILLNKIRFVFQPCFTYDVDKDEINPKYTLMLPIDGNTGLFKKGVPELTIDKPEKLISVSVYSYSIEDNYEFIGKTLKNTKRGIVMFLADETDNEFRTNEEMPHIFGVDTEVIRFANLDEEVEKYKFDV